MVLRALLPCLEQFLIHPNALYQWFSTGVHMDPRGPCNISGGPQAKHNKMGVHNHILVVHEENQLRTLFNIKNSISTVFYTILKNKYE